MYISNKKFNSYNDTIICFLRFSFVGLLTPYDTLCRASIYQLPITNQYKTIQKFMYKIVWNEEKYF